MGQQRLEQLLKEIQLEFDLLTEENLRLGTSKGAIKEASDDKLEEHQSHAPADAPSNPVLLPAALTSTQPKENQPLRLPGVNEESPMEASKNKLAPAKTEYYRGQLRARRSTRKDIEEKTLKSAFNAEDLRPMKEKVKEVLGRQQEASRRTLLSERMAKDGCAQNIARNPKFEQLSLSVVLINSLWFWIDTDLNDAVLLPHAHWAFQLTEHLFCFFFLFEWLVQLLSSASRRIALRDPWFILNSFLLIQMIIETWIMYIVVAFSAGGAGGSLGSLGILRMLRLLRLTRMFRMVRLMVAVPELVFIFKGLLKAVRSVSLTLALLVCVLYIFAIVMRQLTSATEAEDKYFPSVHVSMYSLFLHATLLDNVGTVLTEVGSASWMAGIVFILALWTAAFTLLNMLIGVLCDVMGSVAADEKERMMIAFAKSRVQEAMERLDLDEDEMIAKEEFSSLVCNDLAIEALIEVGVDLDALLDNVDFLFQSDSQGQSFDRKIPFDEFMDLVLQLRATNPATVQDIAVLRRFIQSENTRRNIALELLDERLSRGMEERDLIMDYLELLHDQHEVARSERAALQSLELKELKDLEELKGQKGQVLRETAHPERKKSTENEVPDLGKLSIPMIE